MRLRPTLPSLDVPTGVGRLTGIVTRTGGTCLLLVDAGDAGPAALLVPSDVAAYARDLLRTTGAGLPTVAFRGRIVGTADGLIPVIEGDVQWCTE